MGNFSPNFSTNTNQNIKKKRKENIIDIYELPAHLNQDLMAWFNRGLNSKKNDKNTK